MTGKYKEQYLLAFVPLVDMPKVQQTFNNQSWQNVCCSSNNINNIMPN